MSADDVSLSILRLAWRVDALDKWRDRVDKRIDSLDEKVEGVVNAQAIAHAVADELGRRKSFEWFSLVNIGKAIVAIVVIAGSVKGLIGG